jgi:hypothetical protein
VLTWGFAGKDLNNELQTLGLLVPPPLVFRVLSNVTQYNGSASTIPTSYSAHHYRRRHSLYDQSLRTRRLPGLESGHGADHRSCSGTRAFSKDTSISPAAAPSNSSIPIPRLESHELRGQHRQSLLTTNGNAGGMTVPNGGYYELSANLNTNTWTATATTWSIIGDATPGGWNTDTQMSYDATNQVWTVTAPMISAGSFKFRANDAWVIDFGIDNSGNLQYADNPLFTYNPNLNNLTVPANGTYLITLDLHISGKYTYSAVLQ